jgi:uncharacterized phiE125 gp8 family phage protein
VIKMLRPVLVAAPAVTVWTVDEMKAQLRIDGSDEDNTLTALLAAATGYLDGHAGILGRCMIEQTWLQSFGCFERRLRLPFPDVSSVVVKYFDTDDAEQTVDAGGYQLLEDARGNYLRFVSTFATPAVNPDRLDAVSVAMTVGYGDAVDDVPAALRQAIMLLIGHWYTNREAVGLNTLSALPLGFDALIAPFRRGGV